MTDSDLNEPCRHDASIVTCPDCLNDEIEATVLLATLDEEDAYGMCTACGAVEVKLEKATTTRDMSWCGESPEYPAGYGCELCA